MRIVPGISKQAGWAALVLAVSSFAAPACAATAPITAYFRDSALTGYSYPGPDRATIAIDVKASVGGTCGFATNGAPNAVFNFGEITPGFSATVPFTAECTAPWRIAVSSANGALKNAATVPAGYTNKAPYNVALNVASDGRAGDRLLSRRADRPGSWQHGVHFRRHREHHQRLADSAQLRAVRFGDYDDGTGLCRIEHPDFG